MWAFRGNLEGTKFVHNRVLEPSSLLNCWNNTISTLAEITVSPLRAPPKGLVSSAKFECYLLPVMMNLYKPVHRCKTGTNSESAIAYWNTTHYFGILLFFIFLSRVIKWKICMKQQVPNFIRQNSGSYPLRAVPPISRMVSNQMPIPYLDYSFTLFCLPPPPHPQPF